MQMDKTLLALRGVILALAVALVPCTNAPAQIIKFNFGQKPKVPVTIKHPPQLAMSLKGKTVAFNPVQEACEQQVSDLIMQDFQNQGVQVANRANLDAVFAEQHLQGTQSVAPATAVQIGKLSGAAVMVVLTVTRCRTEKPAPTQAPQYNAPPIYFSRTEAHIQGSVAAIDLATGKNLAFRPIKADPFRQNQFQGAVPEYPSDIEVLDEAQRDAASQVAHVFFPWVETREVSFMNSKACNLKQAYELLKANDIDGALKVSVDNVARCRTDPKPAHQADAMYNLGVTYMLTSHYAQALETLSESQKIHSDKEVVDAIAECRMMQIAEAATQSREAQQAQQEAADHSQQAQRDQQEAQKTLTNDSIIELVKGGLTENILVKMISQQPARFSTGPADILTLKKAGVPDGVIAAMLDKK